MQALTLLYKDEEDHFTKEILKWKNNIPNITYILSKDILKRRRAQKEDADVWMVKGTVWEDECLKVTATGRKRTEQREQSQACLTSLPNVSRQICSIIR